MSFFRSVGTGDIHGGCGHKHETEREAVDCHRERVCQYGYIERVEKDYTIRIDVHGLGFGEPWPAMKQ